jgi:predicted amidohydrolase YtcJ
VVDRDPRELEPDALMTFEPRATMVAGRWVHDTR